MTINPLMLLQQLAGLAAPSAKPASSAASGDLGFSSALSKAQVGGAGTADLASLQPVAFDPDVPQTFDAAQMQRLSLAADKAQAAGMNTALLLIDGQALVMDVASRTITARVDPAAQIVEGIDGLVPVPPATLKDFTGQADPQTLALQSTKQLLERLGHRAPALTSTTAI